jgi:hypothetical protein
VAVIRYGEAIDRRMQSGVDAGRRGVLDMYA